MLLTNIKKNIKRENVICYIAWILFGFIMSFISCSMLISGSSTIHRFYDVGDVCEIRISIFRSEETQEGGHQEKNGRVVLDNGYFEYNVPIDGNKDRWNYLCIQLRDTNGIQWKINYDKQTNGEIIETEEYDFKLYSGMNLLDVPKNSFNVLRITATGERGSSFCIDSMQLRENKPVWSIQKAVLIFVLSFLLYAVVSSFLVIVWHKLGIKIHFHRLIEAIQNLYIVFAKQLRKIISFSSKDMTYIKHCRVVVFVMMFLYGIWVETQDTYYMDFSYHILIYLIFIIIMAVLSMSANMTKKKWSNILVYSWMLLWMMAYISDLLIPKNFRFLSCIMVFGIGFFIFIWNNMQNPEELIRDFTCAIHIFFVFICIFCLLCRPETKGIQYSGISRNPSVFGLYMGTIWAVILGEIETKIKDGYCLKKLLPYIIELCLVLSFCWKAQSACPLLCMMGIGVIWFLKIVCFASKEIKSTLAVTILCGIILLLPVYSGLSAGLKYIPKFTGISITYVGEEPIARKEYGMIVYAKDLKETIKNSRIGHKFSDTTISGIFSGRDYYYRTYLRDMNLFGHEENPEMWGLPRLPHNAVLGIAHRYGIFAIIPYILMLAAVIVRTFRYSLRRGEYTPIPFYVCLSTIVMSMIDNVELPFLWLPWFGLYLLMGIVFDDDIVYGTRKRDNEAENNIL